MTDRRAPNQYQITIDRIVVDGVPGDVERDVLRREVAAEVERLLRRPGITERISTDQRRQHVIHTTEGEGATNPRRIARYIVQAL